MKQLLAASHSAVLILLSAGSAFTCEVKEISSPSELTRSADTIVRAKAIRHAAPKESQRFDPGQVELTVLETLKGLHLERTLEVPGYVNDYAGPNDEQPPYRWVRPGGRRGSCYASDYRIGSEYLLFLKGGSLRWSPLAPTNEQVTGDHDAWVVWVRKEIEKQQSDAPQGPR